MIAARYYVADMRYYFDGVSFEIYDDFGKPLYTSCVEHYGTDIALEMCYGLAVRSTPPSTTNTFSVEVVLSRNNNPCKPSELGLDAFLDKLFQETPRGWSLQYASAETVNRLREALIGQYGHFTNQPSPQQQALSSAK